MNEYVIHEQSIGDNAEERFQFLYRQSPVIAETPDDAAQKYADGVLVDRTKTFFLAVSGPGGAYGEDGVWIFRVTPNDRHVVLLGQDYKPSDLHERLNR